MNGRTDRAQLQSLIFEATMQSSHPFAFLDALWPIRPPLPPSNSVREAREFGSWNSTIISSHAIVALTKNASFQATSLGPGRARACSLPPSTTRPCCHTACPTKPIRSSTTSPSRSVKTVSCVKVFLHVDHHAFVSLRLCLLGGISYETGAAFGRYTLGNTTYFYSQPPESVPYGYVVGRDV